eukprot:4466461-Amphidinium_carterae.5
MRLAGQGLLDNNNGRQGTSFSTFDGVQFVGQEYFPLARCDRRTGVFPLTRCVTVEIDGLEVFHRDF